MTMASPQLLSHDTAHSTPCHARPAAWRCSDRCTAQFRRTGVNKQRDSASPNVLMFLKLMKCAGVHGWPCERQPGITASAAAASGRAVEMMPSGDRAAHRHRAGGGRVRLRRLGNFSGLEMIKRGASTQK